MFMNKELLYAEQTLNSRKLFLNLGALENIFSFVLRNRDMGKILLLQQNKPWVEKNMFDGLAK